MAVVSFMIYYGTERDSFGHIQRLSSLSDATLCATMAQYLHTALPLMCKPNEGC